MLIRVKYTDNRFDMVRPDMLDRLIEKGDVNSFFRRDGWVTPGAGNVRRTSRPGYSGPDRRHKSGQELRKVMSAGAGLIPHEVIMGIEGTEQDQPLGIWLEEHETE